jgi:hypothetical protein
MLTEQETKQLNALVASRFHDRSPIILDSIHCQSVSVAASTSQRLGDLIDCTHFNLLELHVDATFAAAANGAIYVEVRPVNPVGSEPSDEFFGRVGLSQNTSSPYLRQGWLQVDVRGHEMVEIYLTNANTGSATVFTVTVGRVI